VAQTLEIASLERRFVYRGECSPDTNIALVLWDDSSEAKIALGPQFRETIATVIMGLAKMQARAIAVDFFFEEKKAPATDSLLSTAISQSPNAVTAFRHRQLDEPAAAIANPAQKTFAINEYRSFWVASDSVKLFPQLRHSRAHFGHAKFLEDPVTTEERSVPLYIKSDTPRAALALEIAKIYYGITDQQIKIHDGKLVLLPAGTEPIRIPINKLGEYEINFLDTDKTFAQRHSLHEVLDLCRAGIADSAAFVTNRDFTGKLVLIGSTIDDDIFVTPFSDFVPGVFLHATVVNNILHEQFLIRLPRGAEWAILLVVGALLFWLFSKCKLKTQIIGVILILAGYTALTFMVFDHARIIAPLILVIAFGLLSSAMQGAYLHLSALKRQQLIKERILTIANARAQSRLRKQFNSLVPSPHYFFAIDAREYREEYTFISWLKFFEVDHPGIAPFEPEINVSLPVHSNVINKLEHDIQKLWQRYFQGIESEGKRTGNLRDEMKRIGGRIANEFGLKQTFQEVFSGNGNRHPLKLAVNNLKIPWHWAASDQSRELLCEKYPLGFTFFDSTKELSPTLDQFQPKQNHAKNPNRMAVLFYGDWQGNPQKRLNHVRGHIIKLQELLTLQDCPTLVFPEKSKDFLNCLNKACAEKCNLRLIHYSGHAEKDILDVSENDFIKSNTISGKMGLSFPSRPLVFLNACSSGRLPEKWAKMDSLCTEFLACGAGACIVTNFDVYEKTAGYFAKIFYDYFVTHKLNAGEALRSTINDLGKPDKKNDYDPDHDITRYFYTLYGDPTVKF
jgi:CHASE2 domain-containing sensor protein